MHEFLVHGYQNTSITAIVKQVGGSTRNIYDFFSDKHGLLLAVLEHHSEGMVQRFIDIDPSNRSIAQYLQSFAKGYLKAILDPQSMGFYRLAISESVRMPELPRIIMRSAQQVVVGKIGRYFEEQIACGVLKPCNTQDMAEMFIALTRDKMLMRAALDPGRKTSDAELDEFITVAVKLFLEGVLEPAAKAAGAAGGQTG